MSSTKLNEKRDDMKKAYKKRNMGGMLNYLWLF